MSWDVMLLNLPHDTKDISDLPPDFNSTLGSLERIHSQLALLFPAMDLTDPSWAILEGEQFSIEFNIGSKDPCDSIMLHVRGNDEAITPIRHLCHNTGWSAMDMSSGELIDFTNDPASGLRQWRTYRDSVIPNAPVKGVSFTLPDGKRVFADSAPQVIRPPKRWWQFWK